MMRGRHSKRRIHILWFWGLLVTGGMQARAAALNTPPEPTAIEARQDRFDSEPSFETLSPLLEHMLLKKDRSNLASYLSMLAHYATTPEQKAWSWHYRGQYALLNDDFCAAHIAAMELQHGHAIQANVELLAMLLAFQQQKLIPHEALTCAFERSRSMALHRGLKRSQSIFLNIQFATDSHVLSPFGMKQMASVTEALLNVEMRNFELHLVGHADARGSLDYNQSLSERRAQTLKRFLVLKGKMKASKIIAIGAGETLPLVAGDHAEAHALNRRVEIFFSPKPGEM